MSFGKSFTTTPLPVCKNVWWVLCQYKLPRGSTRTRTNLKLRSSYCLVLFSIWKKNWGAQWHPKKRKICLRNKLSVTFFFNIVLTTCLLPIIPKTIHTQIPAVITHRLETPSDSIPENLHFNQLGREAEDYFNEEVSSRFSLLSAGDPFVVVEMEEFLPSSWPVVLLVHPRE